MTLIRVLLADDHTLVLEGLKRLLAADFDLVGMVENGRELLEVAGKLKPDVVLLDISMPLLNGVEAARQLKKTRPDIKIIFLTMHAEKTYVTEAFNAGASGYLLKRSAASELVFAIQEVAKVKCISPLSFPRTCCAHSRIGSRGLRHRPRSRSAGGTNHTPAGSAATRCRRADKQGDCRNHEDLHQDCRVPQVRDHAEPGPAHHGRTYPICSPAWHCRQY